MNMYTIIIGIKRLVRRVGTSNPVDEIALRAARQVVLITLDFTVDPSPLPETALYVCLQ